MDPNYPHMPLQEYRKCVTEFLEKGGQQINLLGGEPLLHLQLREILDCNRDHQIKTTIYTNGDLLGRFNPEFFRGIKLRVSIYSFDQIKGACSIPRCGTSFDANFMISAKTTAQELLDSAKVCEEEYGCKTFFLFNMRALDNPEKEFFTDTAETGSILYYKKLVHEFMWKYDGWMDIHVSKRGVFESTTTLPDTKCRFANQFIGGRIIQCPYDVVNCKYQDKYEFGVRSCQQNNTCLMSKVIYRRIQEHAK
jgi:hypothetical protein